MDESRRTTWATMAIATAEAALTIQPSAPALVEANAIASSVAALSLVPNVVEPLTAATPPGTLAAIPSISQVQNQPSIRRVTRLFERTRSATALEPSSVLPSPVAPVAQPIIASSEPIVPIAKGLEVIPNELWNKVFQHAMHNALGVPNFLIALAAGKNVNVNIKVLYELAQEQFRNANKRVSYRNGEEFMQMKIEDLIVIRHLELLIPSRLAGHKSTCINNLDSVTLNIIHLAANRRALNQGALPHITRSEYCDHGLPSAGWLVNASVGTGGVNLFVVKDRFIEEAQPTSTPPPPPPPPPPPRHSLRLQLRQLLPAPSAPAPERAPETADERAQRFQRVARGKIIARVSAGLGMQPTVKVDRAQGLQFWIWTREDNRRLVWRNS